jgi:drug/metabolite transporter (DMT)-like permease
MPRWLFWMLLTLLSWGIWAILSKFIPADISPAHSQAMSTIGLAPILAALWAMKDPAVPGNRRRGIVLAFTAGLISAVGNVAYYAALGDAKAATIVPLTALYPAVTILLAMPVLKERVTPLQWGGMAVSLAAIYLFNPLGEQLEVSPWFLAALVAITLWGVNMLLQKMSTDHISGRESAIWFFLGFVPIAAIILIARPLPAGISARVWSLEAALGFTLGFGNLTILLAFSSGGKAAVLAPLSGLYPIVSLPIAILILNESIGGWEQLGIALALVAVVMLSYTPAPEPARAFRS